MVAGRQNRRRGLWVGAVIGLILVFVGVMWSTGVFDPGEREERQAASWLARQPAQVPGRLISEEDVPAAGLARVMIRPDSGWLPAHRWLWDHVPKGLRSSIALPRPHDSRWNGIFARAWLERHQQRNQALPVLLAAATDSTRANHAAVMSCLESFGTLDPWTNGDLHLRMVEEGIAGLQDPNPEVRLRMLLRFASAWPGDRTLQRRLDALQKEARGRGILVTPPVNRGTVSTN